MIRVRIQRVFVGAMMTVTACVHAPVETAPGLVAAAVFEAPELTPEAETALEVATLRDMIDSAGQLGLAGARKTRFIAMTRLDIAKIRFTHGDVAAAVREVERAHDEATAAQDTRLVALMASDLCLVLRFVALDEAKSGNFDRAFVILERVAGLTGLDAVARRAIAGDRFLVIDMQSKEAPADRERAALAALSRVLDQAEPARSPVNHRPDSEPVPLTSEMIKAKLARQIGREVKQAELPTNDLGPATETGTIDQSIVSRVVSDNQRSVSTCYDRELKRGRRMRGKLELLVTVAPTGNVQSTAVQTAQFDRTPLGDCIAMTVKRWRFPPFAGEARQVYLPFVLSYF